MRHRLLAEIQPKTEEVVDKVVEEIEEPLGEVASKLSDWAETLTGMIPNFVVAVLVLILFWILARLVGSTVRRVSSRISDNAGLTRVLVTLAKLLTLMAGVFIARGVLQLAKTLTSLLAGAGVIGLALGFAFQNVAANFLSGVLLSIRKPFTVGDVIKTNGFYGTVVDINLRTTDLQMPDGRYVLVPNKEVFEQAIENYSRNRKHRVDVAVGVSYGDDLDKARRLAKEAAEGLEFRDESRDVQVFFTEFGDSSINFVLRMWVDFSRPVDDHHARSEMVMAVKKAFDDNDITIPFPIRTVDFGIKGGTALSEMPVSIAGQKDPQARCEEA